MEEIVRQMLRASRWLWLHAEDYGMDQDRLYVGGHSPAGISSAMLMAAIWPVFDPQLPKDLWKGGSRSAVYTTCGRSSTSTANVDLRLDEATAMRLSPAFMPPASAAPVMTCVGGDESSEFLRQNALLGERWRGAFAGDIPMPGRTISRWSTASRPGEPAVPGRAQLMKLDK